mmetsp:Transcript_2208/g.5892  ORF Transcript_2208/g.5892 Transcript_2208/m.5892 type:complete len:378 (-) Transcript_2208:261-1394(-)
MIVVIYDCWWWSWSSSYSVGAVRPLLPSRRPLGLPSERSLDPLPFLSIPHLAFLEFLDEFVKANVHQLPLGKPSRLGHRPQQGDRVLVRDLRALFQRPPREFLGGVHQRHVLLRHQADGPAPASGPRGSPDAVDVRDGVPRQLGLEDEIHRRDVEAPAGNVRRYQHADLLRLELGEGGKAAVLGEERVQRHVLHPDLGEDSRDERRTLAGGDKDNGRAGLSFVGVVVVRIASLAEEDLPASPPGVTALGILGPPSVGQQISDGGQQIGVADPRGHENVFLFQTGRDAWRQCLLRALLLFRIVFVIVAGSAFGGCILIVVVVVVVAAAAATEYQIKGELRLFHDVAIEWGFPVALETQIHRPYLRELFRPVVRVEPFR